MLEEKTQTAEVLLKKKFNDISQNLNFSIAAFSCIKAFHIPRSVISDKIAQRRQVINSHSALSMF